MENKRAGVVVLFHPERKEVLHNIASYLPYLDHLFIIDNTPSTIKEGIGEEWIPSASNCTYICNERNEGIAHALNQGAAIALEKGYGWLLTMDQDSFFTSDAASAYFSLSAHIAAAHQDAAIIAPAQVAVAPELPVFSNVHAVITSGSLIQLAVWKATGGYKEELFIDEVDHEYAYKVQRAGYRVLRCNYILLNHQLGTKKSGAYLGIIARQNRTVHSSWRVYFMVRNYLYVRKWYKQAFPAEFVIRDRQMLVAIKNNLLFSGNFFSNLKSILKGYLEYKKGAIRP